MKFTSDKIDVNNDIRDRLARSKKAIVAVFCFAPKDLMNVLLQIPDFTLIYSREYDVTDPDSLWKLHTNNNSRILFVDENANEGRLHAKIYYGLRNDKSEFALVCSANMTQKGFLENQEAGVLFDSQVDKDDFYAIRQIKTYLHTLIKTYKENIFHLGEYRRAQIEHSKATRAGRRSSRNKNKRIKEWENIKYWTIKTGSREANEYFQDQFVKYSVIAHGHNKVDHSPGCTKFSKIKKNDLVLICKGYVKPKKPSRIYNIEIYAIARVKHNGYKTRDKDSVDFIEDSIEDSRFKKWIKHWHEIEIIEGFPTPATIPRKRLSASLKLEALPHTCHEIKDSGFYEVIEYLQDQLNIQINV